MVEIVALLLRPLTILLTRAVSELRAAGIEVHMLTGTSLLMLQK